jgi:hypothetical protein
MHLTGIEVKSAVDKMTGMVGSYSTDHIGDEIGANRLASVFGRRDEKRAKDFEYWMQSGNRSLSRCWSLKQQ